MFYCRECQHEIERYHIDYEPAEPSVGLKASADFNCCTGDDVWYVPMYYSIEEFNQFFEHYTEEEIKQRFPDIERATAWDYLEKNKDR